MKINQPLKHRARPKVDIDKKLMQVAKLYEKQFLREMVKAMRGTISHGKLTKPNMAEKIFSEKLDHEYVEKWGDNGGNGLAKIIFRELKEKIIPMQMGRMRRAKGAPMQRPVNPTGKTIKGIKKLPAQSANESHWKIDLDSESVADLKMPWSGRVTKINTLDSGETAVELAHPEGFKSTMVFRGLIDADLKEQNLGPGSTLGVMEAGKNSLVWSLQKA